MEIVSLPILPKEARSHYFLGFLPIRVDFPPLNNRKISKNHPHGNGHNLQAHTTLLENPDKIGHFCAVKKLTGMLLSYAGVV